MLHERRIRFICERCGDNLFHAGFPRGVSERSRINAVAGDDPENFRRLQVCRASRCAARLSILGMMSAAFHVQLRERLLERCLNSRDFLGSMIFFHRYFGALNSSLGRCRVNFLRLKRHIGQH